jgi:hypothetical protein
LWSFAHPVGLYVTGAAGGVVLWDDEIRIEQRALSRRYVAGSVLPVLIITCDVAGTDITFSDVLAGTSWTYTTTGLELTPTMIVPAAGLPVSGLATDPTLSHTITVEVKSADDADELLIHSSFLWSGNPW